MISGCGKALRQPVEQSLAVVVDLADFAVHQSRSADDLPAENFADRLMAKTDAEYRGRLMKVADGIFRDSGIGRSPGPRRDHDTIGFEPLHLLESDLVIAIDADIFTELSKILNKVVGERIVVIDDKNHALFQLESSL